MSFIQYFELMDNMGKGARMQKQFWDLAIIWAYLGPGPEESHHSDYLSWTLTGLAIAMVMRSHLSPLRGITSFLILVLHTDPSGSRFAVLLVSLVSAKRWLHGFP